MVSSTNLLMIFISLETVSLTSYILAGFLTHNPRSSEAAFKYITFGAVASGTMLFGFSLLFGLTGTGDVVQISSRLTEMFSAGEAYPLVVLVIVTFILAGVGYKMASVPFHMWSPDVYEGAPIPITAFLSVASKAAGFALFIRFSIRRSVFNYRWCCRLVAYAVDCLRTDDDGRKSSRAAAAERQETPRVFKHSARRLFAHGRSIADSRGPPSHSLLPDCLPVYEFGGVLCGYPELPTSWGVKRLTATGISGLARRLLR